MYPYYFDFETLLIKPGLLSPPPVCMAGLLDDSEVPAVLVPDDAIDTLKRALTNVEGQIFVGHNVAFDWAVACAHDPDLIPLVFKAYADGRVRDTQIRQQLLDIRAGVLNRRPNAHPDVGQYALASLVFDYLGADRTAEKNDANGWRLRYAELRDTPLVWWPKEALEYVQQDVLDTRAVFQAQGERAAKEQYLDPDDPTGTALVDEIRQTRAAWALHLTSCWGMRTDRAKVEKLEAWAKTEFKKLQDRMFAEGLYRLEPLTNEDLREGRQPDGTMPEVLTKKGKVSVKTGRPAKYVKNTDVIRERVANAFADSGQTVPRTDKGAVKTDADTMKLTGDELLEELAEGGPIGTVLRTFLPALKQGTEVPIGTRYRVLLETGRISSSNPNLNNLPREIKNKPADVPDVRECVVPRPEFLICSIDLDSAELRALGQVCLWLFGVSELAKFFQTHPDGDAHLILVADELGITYEEAVARKKAGDPEVKGLRKAFKPVSLGFYGGLGAEKFSTLARKNYGVIYTTEQSRQKKAQWMARFPEMARYFEYINARVGFGDARIPQLAPPWAGKHRERGGVGYCDGCNGLVQGLTADSMKAAHFAVAHECYVDLGTPLYGSRPIGNIYDELLIEVPEDLAHEASFRARDVIVAEVQKWLPSIPVRATPAIARFWTKEMEAVFDANDRLIPWQKKEAA